MYKGEKELITVNVANDQEVRLLLDWRVSMGMWTLRL